MLAVRFLDSRNTNSLWASVLVETLARCGVRRVVICPGSRSAPLTMAFAAHATIEAVPVLDERSAGFFALGLARQSHQPVALVCTSGTAAANFFPTIIEAHESGVPLLVLTADRPPELRACASGQTIDQQKLYGGYVGFYHEFALPALDEGLLRYLRQTVVHAVGRTLAPSPGAVHLNVPFRDPLAPTGDGGAAEAIAAAIDWPGFFVHLDDTAGSGTGVPPAVWHGHPARGHGRDAHATQSMGETPMPPQKSWAGRPCHADHGQDAHATPDMGRMSMPFLRPDRAGVIVAGPAQPADATEYVEGVAELAQRLGWPVLADGLSPLRNYASRVPHLVTTYDLVLRNPDAAARLKPDVILCLGGWPTSKVLRGWVESSDANVYLVGDRWDNRDPLHARTSQLRTSPAAIASALPETSGPNEHQRRWNAYEERARAGLEARLRTHAEMFEPKAAWLLAQHLPPETPLVIANSMPIRDVEYVWAAGNRRIQPFCNRGANGIDGTLSTALGIAHDAGRPAVLLTGDLALLHDSNGFLIRPKFRGSLTIVLINNRGGGIFEHLPIAEFEPPFEEFFATPQEVDLAKLCAAHEVEHVWVREWAQFEALISALPSSGLRVLELRTDRKRDAALRKRWFAEIAAGLA